jgi:hypothetical protein
MHRCARHFFPEKALGFPAAAALENDVCGWSYLIVFVEIETSRFLILFS